MCSFHEIIFWGLNIPYLPFESRPNMFKISGSKNISVYLHLLYIPEKTNGGFRSDKNFWFLKNTVLVPEDCILRNWNALGNKSLGPKVVQLQGMYFSPDTCCTTVWSRKPLRHTLQKSSGYPARDNSIRDIHYYQLLLFFYPIYSIFRFSFLSVISPMS